MGIWEDSGNTWDHLRWDHLGPSEIIYLDHLGSSRIIWDHLGACVIILNDFGLFLIISFIWVIWDHLGVGLDLGPGPRHNFLAIGSKISGVKSEACATKQNKGKRPYIKNPHIINKLRQGLFKTHKFNREGGQALVCKSVSFTMQK